jgi:NAD(P)-dependent dehydrogenase (short-subunit alcohol dehydrogenase family)
MSDLSEKVVIVTGSSSGMGRSMALAFAEAGASVVCADLRKSARAEGWESDIEVDTDDLISRNGGKCIYVETDVSDASAVDNLVSSAVAEYGRLDVMVNNAGLMQKEIRPIQDEPEETFDRVFGVNAKGTWLCCRAAIKQMLEQPVGERLRGKIINFGSIAAMSGDANYAAYQGSKGAIISMTYALAAECGPNKITVNALAPGCITTAMTAGVGLFAEGHETRTYMEGKIPTGELGTAEDIAGPALFLASDASDYVNGVLFPVDGGLINVI